LKIIARNSKITLNSVNKLTKLKEDWKESNKLGNKNVGRKSLSNCQHSRMKKPAINSSDNAKFNTCSRMLREFKKGTTAFIQYQNKW
jgi:hypothetical protein